MTKYLYILLVSLILNITQLFPQILSTEKLYQKVLPSIATLEVQKNNGDIVLGAAFLIKSEGIAVTCFHVIKDAKVVKAKFSDGEEYLASGLIDKDEKRDLAVIKIKCYKENTLTLSKEEPKVGAPAYIIGSPKGLEFSISDCIISQIQTFEGSKQYQFTCPASPGNSGGPLLNNKGEVLGVVSWQVSQGQNLNFAVPSYYVLGLDNSLPTTPWVNVDYKSDKIIISTTDKEYVMLIADLFESSWDQRTSLQEVSNKILKVDYGYRLTIPPRFYEQLIRNKTIIDKLNNLHTQDATLAKISQTLISGSQSMIKSADILREAIGIAKENNGWDAKSEDLLSQSNAFARSSEFITDDMLKYLSSLSDFMASLSDDFKAFLDGRSDSLGFSLGIMNYSDEPCKIIIVDNNSFASDLGLSAGDFIQSINYTPVKSIYEIKNIILANRGGFLTFRISNNGESKTITSEIPKDLTKYQNQ